MLVALLVGTLTIFVNMLVQVFAVVVLIRFFANRRRNKAELRGLFEDTWMLAFCLVALFAGNVFQFTIWASLFIYLGEFQDFTTAFYHSTVNFASLGYGDIVMSEQWRLLGALEAANGVLMFGLTAGTLFSIMQNMVQQHHTTH